MSRNRYRKRLPPSEGTVFDSPVYPRTLRIAPAGEERVLFEIDENPRFRDSKFGLVEFPAAEVPHIMSAMVACTGKYPRELIEIAHQKGYLGVPVQETRQARRAREREKSQGKYAFVDSKGRRPEIPDSGYFVFTDDYGETLRIEPDPAEGKWRVLLTITSPDGSSAQASFAALDVIPIFVKSGESTGMDSETLARASIEQGYMKTREIPLNRAQKRRNKVGQRRPRLGNQASGSGLAFTKGLPLHVL